MYDQLCKTYKESGPADRAKLRKMATDDKDLLSRFDAEDKDSDDDDKESASFKKSIDGDALAAFLDYVADDANGAFAPAPTVSVESLTDPASPLNKGVDAAHDGEEVPAEVILANLVGTLGAMQERQLLLIKGVSALSDRLHVSSTFLGQVVTRDALQKSLDAAVKQAVQAEIDNLAKALRVPMPPRGKVETKADEVVSDPLDGKPESANRVEPSTASNRLNAALQKSYHGTSQVDVRRITALMEDIDFGNVVTEQQLAAVGA